MILHNPCNTTSEIGYECMSKAKVIVWQSSERESSSCSDVGSSSARSGNRHPLPVTGEIPTPIPVNLKVMEVTNRQPALQLATTSLFSVPATDSSVYPTSPTTSPFGTPPSANTVFFLTSLSPPLASSCSSPLFDNDDPFHSPQNELRDNSCAIPDLIVAFDLTHEIFTELPLPDTGGVGGGFEIDVALLGDSLCMTVNFHNSKMDVWVMREYNRGDSWCKLFTLEESRELRSFKCLRPLGYSSDGNKVLLEHDRKRLCWYDLGKKEVTLVRIQGLPNLNEAMICLGTLVTPYFLPRQICRKSPTLGCQRRSDEGEERAGVQNVEDEENND
ncbi:F-box protein CPR30 [Glycine soja]|nr:F-box protein CPR30 [Glycine soja]